MKVVELIERLKRQDLLADVVFLIPIVESDIIVGSSIYDVKYVTFTKLGDGEVVELHGNH